MPAYIIAEVEVTNPTGYEVYRPLAGASVAQYGGKFVVRGGKAELVEGAQEPARIVVIEFADAAIGKMVRALKSQGLLEETLVVITAKHGQSPVDSSRYTGITT